MLDLLLNAARTLTIVRELKANVAQILPALTRLEARMSVLDPIKQEVDQVLADDEKLKADVAAVVAQQKLNAQTLLDLKAQLDAAQGDPAALADISGKLTKLHGDMTDTASALEAVLPAPPANTGTGATGGDTGSATAQAEAQAPADTTGGSTAGA